MGGFDTCGRTQKTGSNSRAVAWEVERAAKPGDMPLIPPFHVFMLTDSRCCSQYRAHFNISHFCNLGKDFLKHGFLASNTNFFPGLLAYTSASRRAKNIPKICCKKKKKHSKYGALLILFCDKLRSHLQSDWLINLLQKVQYYNPAQKHDKTQKSVDICKECIFRTANPCAPKTSKPKLYGDTPWAVGSIWFRF